MNNIDNQNINPVYIVIMIALFLVGGLAGYFIGAEFNKYKTAVNVMFPSLPDEISSITGTIITSGNPITLEITSLKRFLPGEEIKTEERIISLNSETQIVKQNSFESLEEEITETSIGLNDLKEGDMILVEAAENIKTKKEFTAIKITLLEQLQ